MVPLCAQWCTERTEYAVLSSSVPMWTRQLLLMEVLTPRTETYSLWRTPWDVIELMSADGMPSLTSFWRMVHTFMNHLACETLGWQFIAELRFKPRRDSLEWSKHTSRPSCQPTTRKDDYEINWKNRWIDIRVEECMGKLVWKHKERSWHMESCRTQDKTSMKYSYPPPWHILLSTYYYHGNGKMNKIRHL